MNTQQPDPSEKPPIEKLRSWVAMARTCLGHEIGGLGQDNIDHLEKLIEDLVAKLAGTDKQSDEFAEAMYLSHVKDLEAKLAAAEKDLEWLEKMASTEGYFPVFGYLEHEDGTIPEADDPYYYIVDSLKDEPKNWVGYGKTLREAIEAARNGKEE